VGFRTLELLIFGLKTKTHISTKNYATNMNAKYTYSFYLIRKTINYFLILNFLQINVGQNFKIIRKLLFNYFSNNILKFVNFRALQVVGKKLMYYLVIFIGPYFYVADVTLTFAIMQSLPFSISGFNFSI
jgi:hypothetical protein